MDHKQVDFFSFTACVAKYRKTSGVPQAAANSCRNGFIILKASAMSTILDKYFKSSL